MARGKTFFIMNFVFSTLAINNCIPSATYTLKCKHCDQKPPNALRTIVSSLAKVPDKQVCVWSVSGAEEERVVKYLVSSYKTVASFMNDKVDSVPLHCRHNVLVTNGSRELGCRGLLSPSLPLTADHHYYVLVPGRLNCKDLGPCSEQFGIARAAFISLLDASVFSLSSPLFPQRRFLRSNLTSILEHESLNRVNLEGRSVSIATFNCYPFVVIRDKNNIDSITGIEWNVLKNMARIMNFTIQLVELKGSNLWGHLENGSWTGGITRAMYDRNAEIALCNLWYTSETYLIMDFASPLNMIKFSFIVPRPKPQKLQWTALIQVFDRHVWILILVSYFLYTISYCKFIAVDHSQEEARPGLARSALTMFGILMGTNWPPHGGRSSVRQLVTWWCVFVLLLSSTYNTSIASRLTLQRYEQRVDTIQQLVQRGFHWSDSPNYNRKKRSTYFNFARKWQREWEHRYVPISPPYMKAALDSGKFAFPIQRWGNRLLFFTVEGLDVHRDLHGMRVVKEQTSSTYVTIKFAKHSPLFKASKIALLRVAESGLVRYWSMLVSRAPENLYGRRLLQEEEGRTSVKKIGMSNFGPVFLMFGLGLFASFIIFILEYICKKEETA